MLDTKTHDASIPAFCSSMAYVAVIHYSDKLRLEYFLQACPNKQKKNLKTKKNLPSLDSIKNISKLAMYTHIPL